MTNAIGGLMRYYRLRQPCRRLVIINAKDEEFHRVSPFARIWRMTEWSAQSRIHHHQ